MWMLPLQYNSPNQLGVCIQPRSIRGRRTISSPQLSFVYTLSPSAASFGVIAWFNHHIWNAAVLTSATTLTLSLLNLYAGLGCAFNKLVPLTVPISSLEAIAPLHREPSLTPTELAVPTLASFKAKARTASSTAAKKSTRKKSIIAATSSTASNGPLNGKKELFIRIILDKKIKILNICDSGAKPTWSSNLVQRLHGAFPDVPMTSQPASASYATTNIPTCRPILEEDRLRSKALRVYLLPHQSALMKELRETTRRLRRTSPVKEPETSDEEPNKTKSIWTRNSISLEEYGSFYRSLTEDFPVQYFSVEAHLESKTILCVPKSAPFDLFQSKNKHNNRLYVHGRLQGPHLRVSQLRRLRGLAFPNLLPKNKTWKVIRLMNKFTELQQVTGFYSTKSGRAKRAALARARFRCRARTRFHLARELGYQHNSKLRSLWRVTSRYQAPSSCSRPPRAMRRALRESFATCSVCAPSAAVVKSERGRVSATRVLDLTIAPIGSPLPYCERAIGVESTRRRGLLGALDNARAADYEMSSEHSPHIQPSYDFHLVRVGRDSETLGNGSGDAVNDTLVFHPQLPQISSPMLPASTAFDKADCAWVHDVQIERPNLNILGVIHLRLLPRYLTLKNMSAVEKKVVFFAGSLALALDPDNRIFIISEFIENVCLSTVTTNPSPFPLATDIARSRPRLLSFPQVHPGDLKGENLLVISNGQSKLTDFWFRPQQR
ncbi:Hsp90 protein-domain-containing protein [Favolaschia claudopus]|uniref:Hsp90 protein-domain-containing protein n=1 Tax=Favolaschia claudopus TaxID=2862362 RepID=A0AAW0ALC3_9AGAR